MLLIVPDDYTTIQDAVDTANPGDEILVRSGIYAENVVVTTSNIKFIGEIDTTLDGSTLTGIGFQIIADGIGIDKFRIKGFNIGIAVTGEGCLIQGSTIVFNNLYGIKLIGNSNRFMNLSIGGNLLAGVSMEGNGNLFDHNTLDANAIGGISFTTGGGTGNIFTDNNFSASRVALTLLAATAVNNIVSRNIIRQVEIGISYFSESNTMESNFIYDATIASIIIVGNGNIIAKNVVDKGIAGIMILGDENLINSNNAANMASAGITVTGVGDIVSNNVLLGNNVGILILADDTVIEENVYQGNTKDFLATPCW